MLIDDILQHFAQRLLYIFDVPKSREVYPEAQYSIPNFPLCVQL